MDDGTKALLLLPVAFAFLGLALFMYFLPMVIAYRRKHPQANAIAVLTIFGGWTTFLWVGALVWSVMAFDTRDPESGTPGRSTVPPSLLVAVVCGVVAMGAVSVFFFVYTLASFGTPTAAVVRAQEPSVLGENSEVAHAAPVDERTVAIASEIRGRCARDWKDNFFMQESCISQETNSEGSLRREAMAHAVSSPERRIADRCARQWGGEHAQIRSWFMARSCYDQELGAYKRLHAK